MPTPVSNSCAPASQWRGSTPESQWRESTHTDVSKTSRVQPTVRFATNVFYVKEGEQLRVAVQRLGPCASATSSVDWQTWSSPYEGIKFKACSGTLSFQPGELFQEFEVPLIDDDNFSSAVQFRVGLSNPIGCSLGTHFAIVMIQDNDVFPSNRYKEHIEYDRTTMSWQEGESWNMFKEFARFLFHHTPGSKKVLMSDQVDNIVFFIEIVVMRLLVNTLSSREAGTWITFVRLVSGNQSKDPVESGELNASIIGLGLIVFMPYFLTHWLMYKRTTWKVTGGARAVLQENLLRKYLSQDESKAFAPTAFFLDSFGHDVGVLVANGYLKLFAFAKSIGRLLIALLLTLAIALQTRVNNGVDLAFMGLLPFVVLPVCIFVMLHTRHDANLSALARIQTTEDALLDKVDKATECYRMVADMDTRALVVSDCLSDTMQLNGVLSLFAGLMANNMSILHWATGVLQFLWILIAGHAVAESYFTETERELDLGSFLAVLSLIQSNGVEFENLFELWLTLQTNYPSMWNIVLLMNVHSDLDGRMTQQRAHLSHSRALIEEVHQKYIKAGLTLNEFPEDTMPLTFESFDFGYPSLHLTKVATRQSLRLRNLNVPIDQSTNELLYGDFSRQFQQGSIIAMTGPHGSGKSTMLRLIGKVLSPLTGTISIPPYLRILHVAAENMVWSGTLAENIFFGVCASMGMKTDQYATLDRQILERGWHVCRALKFPKHLQALAEDLETTKELKHFALPASHAKLIHLARAFITDPEILVVHAPTLGLPLELRRVVMDAFSEFVVLRGLMPDDQRQQSRRPRTVFFSTVEPLDLTYADQVVRLGPMEDNSEGDIVGSVMMEVPTFPPEAMVFKKSNYTLVFSF